MMFIYLIVLLDTTGTWVTISAITGEDLSDKRIDRATIGEGVGCLVGSLFGGTPMTGYSSNAGVLAITKVGSRMAIIAGGMILMVLGVCPKLMTVISCIPTPVVMVYLRLYVSCSYQMESRSYRVSRLTRDHL